MTVIELLNKLTEAEIGKTIRVMSTKIHLKSNHWINYSNEEVSYYRITDKHILIYI